MININKVRTVNDFPVPGIKFYDITTVLNDPEEFQNIFNALLEEAKKMRPDVIVALEARGYLFGPALALALNIPFAPIRKMGKLPYQTHKVSYQLEYGVATIEMHVNAIKTNQRVLLFDDILATGGTCNAAINLINNFTPEAITVLVFMELKALNGRAQLQGIEKFTSLALI